MNLDLTVMMYHYVRDPGDAAEAGSGIPGLPKQSFANALDSFARDYAMVSWNDVRAAMLDQKSLPERACLLTFDDGVCDHYLNVFPELSKRGMSGLFFVMARRTPDTIPLPHKLHLLIAKLGLQGMRDQILARLTPAQRAIYDTAESKYRLRYSSETDIVKSVLQRELSNQIDPLLTELLEHHVGPDAQLAQQLFLNDGQVREMLAGGMHVGGHSQTHPWFDFINAPRRQHEIEASRAWLRTVTAPPFAFAYPYGGLADDAPDLLGQNEFLAAFTTREKITQTEPYYIGRFDGEELLG